MPEVGAERLGSRSDFFDEYRLELFPQSAARSDLLELLGETLVRLSNSVIVMALELDVDLVCNAEPAGGRQPIRPQMGRGVSIGIRQVDDYIDVQDGDGTLIARSDVREQSRMAEVTPPHGQWLPIGTTTAALVKGNETKMRPYSVGIEVTSAMELHSSSGAVASGDLFHKAPSDAQPTCRGVDDELYQADLVAWKVEERVSAHLTAS